MPELGFGDLAPVGCESDEASGAVNHHCAVQGGSYRLTAGFQWMVPERLFVEGPYSAGAGGGNQLVAQTRETHHSAVQRIGADDASVAAVDSEHS